MTSAEEITNRLPKPLYAVAGASEIAYRGLRTLPDRVEALRDQLTPRVRTLRAELPGRVEALRTEVPARVNTLVAGAREVYGGLVARGEKVVDAARTRRPVDAATGTALAAAPVKAVRKAVKKAVRKAATPKGSRGPQA
jgi:hypothetical protein